MTINCFHYHKGFEEWQRFDIIHLVPVTMLHHIIKSRSYHSCWLDFIGQAHPPSPEGHLFVLAAIDYFTRWIETIHLMNTTHKDSGGARISLSVGPDITLKIVYTS
jgi:hypothetical protein